MNREIVRPASLFDRGLRQLMIVVGVVLVATPLAELAVRLTHGERPQVPLLGGLCLIGILTVSHATRTEPGGSRRTAATAGKSGGRLLAGDALWLPEGET